MKCGHSSGSERVDASIAPLKDGHHLDHKGAISGPLQAKQWGYIFLCCICLSKKELGCKFLCIICLYDKGYNFLCGISFLGGRRFVLYMYVEACATYLLGVNVCFYK